jgi:hypothetical protein
LPMWLRLPSGMAITAEKVMDTLGALVPSLSDQRCPALDLTCQCECLFSSPQDSSWKGNFYTGWLKSHANHIKIFIDGCNSV